MKALLEEALALRSRFDEEPSHSDQVAALALQIFDALRDWHRRGARERDLLHSAALLHDIGWSQTPDGRGHHKIAARMIAAHDWQSLKTGEVDLVAQIARYHRKAMPEPGHASFHALGRAGQEEVMLLGGILRVADALDRTHTGRIAKIAGAAVSDEALTIRVVPHGDWDAEREMFALKRNLLERVAERPVIVKAAEA